MKKTIAIFTGYYIPFLGGIERYTQKLSTELIALGYKVIIITSNHNKMQNVEESDCLKIYRIPILNLFKSRYPIPKINSEYRKILKCVINEKIDYIICNTRFHLTTLIGCKVARKKGINVALIEHGSSHFTVNNKFLDFFGEIYEHLLTYIVKRKVDYFYGVSKRCNEWLKHFKIRASGVFYNSIDKNTYFNNKDSFYIKKSNKIIISYVGRLIREKGLYLLLDSFQNLCNNYNNILTLTVKMS